MSATETTQNAESSTVTQSIKLLAGTNGLLGLWMIAAPFIWGAPTADLWNDVIVGIVIAGLAGYNYYRETNGQTASRASAALNTLLGLWLIAAPFVFGVDGVLLWNDVIVGAIITLFAGYNWGVGGFGSTSNTAQA